MRQWQWHIPGLSSRHCEGVGEAQWVWRTVWLVGASPGEVVYLANSGGSWESAEVRQYPVSKRGCVNRVATQHWTSFRAS